MIYIRNVLQFDGIIQTKSIYVLEFKGAKLANMIDKFFARFKNTFVLTHTRLFYHAGPNT